MKNKKEKKIGLRALVSLSVILCIVFSSFPTYVVSAGIEHFIGLNDIEVEEGAKVNLLENVSAYSEDNESLEVTVTAVFCQNNSNFVYDHSNSLIVGNAGSEYTVEYLAISPTDESITYTGSRKITSIKHQEEWTPGEEFSRGETISGDTTRTDSESTPEEGDTSEQQKTPEGEEAPEIEGTTQNGNTEFDENKPFTISELKGMGYRVQMDGAKIRSNNFKLECLDGGVPSDDSLVFPADIEWIEGGKIKDHVPQFVNNSNDKQHAYMRAHVGNVPVYYMGILHIEDVGESKDYVYYTTDTEITSKTVYAVLNEEKQEKIILSYLHDSDYKIDYKLIEKGTTEEGQGPDGWSYEEVFGEDRAIVIKKGGDVSVNAKIPRGYKATIKVERQDYGQEPEQMLGQMMSYERNGNKIDLKSDSPKFMEYETSFHLKNVTGDVVITLEYEKVEQIHFNAFMWTQTDYAKNRIQVHGQQTPTLGNSNLTSRDHSFTWEWDGITSKGTQIDGGDGTWEWNTWELDQLEINNESLIIPMVALGDTGKIFTKTVVLSTGTEVTLSVTSMGGTNAVNGRRHYKLEIKNCYEDITISGGNMVGHRHQEYAIRELFGVRNPEYYSLWKKDGIYQKQWITMRQDTLIPKIGYSGENEWTDPFRFKRETGYYKPDISFMTKEGDVLQKNSGVGLDEDNDGEAYIEYLIRKDVDQSGNSSIMGDYEVVSFDDWDASADGYYYFRGTDEVKEYVGKPYTDSSDQVPEKPSHGIVLVNINAYLIRIGVDFLNGADENGMTAPRAENIVNQPKTQYGGKNGYNLVDNQKIMISNLIPVDKKNQFVFDHWEMMATDRGPDEKQWGYLTGEVKRGENGKPYMANPGEEYILSVPMLDELDNCFYMKADPDSGDTDGNPFDDEPHKGAETHAILTLRAVWKKVENKPTIPYTVKYITAEVKNGEIDKNSEMTIEEHAHTVNEGAKLVTDLYQDGNKTISENITAVLKGENLQKEDYTKGGSVRWVVYEPKTTKMIEHVDMQHNEAIIYLIKGNSKINVEKVWISTDHTESEVTVQLQRRKTDADVWEKVENIPLNETNQWKHQFDVDIYYELPSEEDALKNYIWQYRVVEVDGNDEVIEEGKSVVLNNNTYQVGYTYDKEKDAWVIQNTRLLDLMISKVVEGNLGDHTKAFTFDIHAVDSAGKALNGDYNYLGSIKEGTGDSVQKPEDGTLTFKEGNAQISLKHGQQITIKNLPVNAKITVTEQKADGYTTSYQVNGEAKDNGEVILNTHSTVDVTNKNQQVPDTGILDHTQGIAAGIAVAAVGLAFLLECSILRSRKGQRR